MRKMAIFMLNIPIHEHVSLHLFRSSLMSLKNYLQIYCNVLVQKSCTYIVKFISKYFMFYCYYKLLSNIGYIPCAVQHILVAYLFILIYFIYLFLAALGLCCCTRAFSSCGEWGLLFGAVRGLLIGVASLVAEHSL